MVREEEKRRREKERSGVAVICDDENE